MQKGSWFSWIKKINCNTLALTAGVWFQSSIWFAVDIFTRRHENHPIQSPGGRHGVKIWHVAFCLRIALILKSSSSRSSPQTEDKYWTVEQYGAGKRARARAQCTHVENASRKEQACYSSVGTRTRSSHTCTMDESWYQALFAARWGRGHTVGVL